MTTRILVERALHIAQVKGVTSRNALLTTAYVATFLTLVGGMRAYSLKRARIGKPLFALDAAVPDAAAFGNPKEAIQRTRNLIPKLRRVNWDPFKIPRSELVLPDYRFSTSKRVRTGRSSCFAFPHLASRRDPENEPLAMLSDLYVRSNYVAYSDGTTRPTPTGFYILGWKNGDVTTVAVDKVRWVRSKITGRGVATYSGMKEYDPDGLPDPAFLFSDGRMDDPVKKKAYYDLIYDKASPEACRVAPNS